MDSPAETAVWGGCLHVCVSDIFTGEGSILVHAVTKTDSNCKTPCQLVLFLYTPGSELFRHSNTELCWETRDANVQIL